MSNVERPVPYDRDGRLWRAVLTGVSDALTTSGRLARTPSRDDSRAEKEQRLQYALDEIDLKIVTLEIQRHRIERKLSELE